MLIIVIEKPMQFTMVKAVPLSLEGAFLATKVENKGESAITTIPQKTKKAIKRYSLEKLNIKGDIIQHKQDAKRKLKAVFLTPKICEI